MVVDGLLSQDDTLIVEESSLGVDGAARGVKGEAATLGFAVDGHSLAATGTWLKPGISRGREVAGEGAGELVGIEPAEQPLERRLVGGDAIGEAERSEQIVALVGAPLGDC